VRHGVTGRSSLLGGLAAVAPLLVFLAAFFFYPVTRMLLVSFTQHPSPYQEIWSKPYFHHIFAVTFQMSFWVTAYCLLLGFPVAYTLSIARPRVANLLLIAVVTPFWISLLARNFTWMIVLQRGGAVNQLLLALHLVRAPVPLIYNALGMYIGMVFALLPIMILSLYAVMRGIDPSLMRAAENLGASDWQAFRRVFFPLSLPGMAAGCLMIFVISLGFYITPALLGGGRITPVAMVIEALIHLSNDWGLASALAFVLVVATVLVLVVYNRVLSPDRLAGPQ
jgi:putative spermidine/putrescine transport system permease protein